MIVNQRRLAFAAQLLTGRVQQPDKSCPYCGAKNADLLYRRYVLMDVLRCRACGLRYRYPKAAPAVSEAYYQRRYEEFETSTLTQLPAEEKARSLAGRGFTGSAWDESERLEVLGRLGVKPRLLDFGCSWGYFTSQAERAGYEAFGFEISKRRAAFGRDVLGLRILDDNRELDQLPPGCVDVIYSSHVLEHLPRLDVFPLFHRLLAEEGALVLFLPNAAGATAVSQGRRWGGISEVHTLGFDAEFFLRNLPREGFEVQCFSDPYERFAEHGGDELLVVARKVGRSQ